MKNLFVLSILTVFIYSNSIAQNLIAVQNGGQPKFFQQVDDAITNAVNGDTLYIPGGSWNISTQINKRLHLIGVGHHPDSTKVTFPTKLLGSLNLYSGADDGSYSGILLEGGIYIGQQVNSYLISRCNISGGIYFSTKATNFIFRENIIHGSIGSGTAISGENCSFFNNIIRVGINTTGIPFVNSTFTNNIFLNSVDFFTQYALFENNVFLSSSPYPIGGVMNSILKNNLFTGGNPFPTGTDNVGSNNITGQNPVTVLVNQLDYVFSYSNDYHLQPTSPGKNAGTDGTDVGIYGGIYPWKEGSIPSNPHFQSVKISPTTDASGNINVKIKVSAQDR